MSLILSQKKWFLKTALAYLGTPYVWGGEDPSGFDCSGYVIECLKSAGFLSENEDFTADGLFRLFKNRVVNCPQAGALLFYINAKGTAVHVVICLDAWHQIGASGGDSKTVNESRAWETNAYVKIRPIRFDSSRMKVVQLF